MKKLGWSAAVLIAIAAFWISWPKGPESASRLEELQRLETARPSPDSEGGEGALEERSRAPSEGSELRAAGKLGTLRIRVVHAAPGSPAANTLVRYRATRDRDSAFAWRSRWTDASGTIVAADLEPGKYVVMTPQDLKVMESGVVKAGETTDVLLELKDGILLRGLVVDPDDRPVAGASVMLYLFFVGPAVEVGRTGADGRFAIQGVANSCYVGARAAGFAPSFMRSVTASKGGTAEVKIQLPGAGGAIRGKVTGPSGEGVAGVLLRAGPIRHEFKKFADGTRGLSATALELRTEADGTFLMPGLAAGRIEVEARARGLAPWRGSCEVLLASESPLFIQLRKGSTCSGRVTRADGEAAKGVEIHVGNPRRLANFSARTDVDGRYRLTGLPAEPFEISARSESLGRAKAKFPGAPGAKFTWDPQLGSGIVLRGRVISESRQPVPKLMIDVVQLRAEKGKRAFRASAVTDAKGRFEVRNCPPGVKLLVRVRGGIFDAAERHDVDPTKGELVIQVSGTAKPSVRIQGVVLDPDGKPLENARVQPEARGGGGVPFFMTAVRTGAFDVGPFRPGSYRVSIVGKGYPTYRSEERKLAEGEVWKMGTIRMQRGERLEISLRGNGELGRVRCFLEFLSDWKTRAAAQRATVGRDVSSELLAAGSYRLQLTGEGIATQSVPVTVLAGQPARVELRLSKGLRQEFFFTAPAATGGRELRVTIHRGETLVYDRRTMTPRDRGVAWVRYLAAGSYRIRAVGRSGLRAERSFRVGSNAGPKTALRLMLR